MTTLYAEFKSSVDQYKRRPAVYWKEKRGWRSYDYCEFSNFVNYLAGGLFAVGVKKNTKVAILSENRPKWLMSDLALNKLGAVSVPIHITSNKSLIEYILENSDSGFLIVSENIFEKNYDWISVLENIKIIVIENREKKDFEKHLSFNGLISSGKEVEVEEERADEDFASVIYTSGTTGDPKGVMLSNQNFLFNIRNIDKVIKIEPQDKFLSFLPLSHVLERTAGSFVPIMNGSAIAYSEGINELAQNLLDIKPTVLVSVPKIFERFHEKVYEKVKLKKPLQKKIFFWALKQGKSGLRAKIADKMVYSKIRENFGGNLRFAVSGGASINEQILRFFQKIGVKVVEGYGLTETAPLVAVNSLEESKVGSVGKALPGVEIEIAGDKEILVKGGNVMLGYWNKPEDTSLVIIQGWFRTGDLGFLDEDGFLTIIGRKKEMIVLSNGKNVSPEKTESLLNLSPYISQSLVSGHKKKHLVALVVPNLEKIKIDFPQSQVNVRSIIFKELDKINQKLPPHEQIKNFALLPDQFTVEAGELTPTLKIRRSIIEGKYESKIKDLYK